MNILLYSDKRISQIQNIFVVESAMDSIPKETSDLSNSQLEELWSFQQMKVSENIIKGVYGIGFEKPSNIQKRIIPAFLQGRSMIVQSRAGSGKTAAYIIGLLGRIKQQLKQVQAIVVTPTREIAIAVKRFIEKIAEYTEIYVEACISGQFIKKEQKQNANKIKPQIIVGTPGRILNHIDNNIIKTNFLKMIILDEADQFFPRFSIEIHRILQQASDETQSCLFSSTYQQSMIQLLKNHMRNPIKLTFPLYNIQINIIPQFHVRIQEDSQKFTTLVKICNNLPINKCIIFVKNNNSASQLGNKLNEISISATVYHSQIKNANQALSKFRSGKAKILICTDSMGRAINTSNVNFVINFGMPSNNQFLKDYFERISNLEKSSVVINFILSQDLQLLDKLRKHYGIQIPCLPLDPTKVFSYLS